MKSYVETFFRRPFLLVLPFLLVPSLVAVGFAMLPAQYEVSAALQIKDPTSDAPTTQTNVVTPAVTEARAFNERLGTLAFKDHIISQAGLLPSVQERTWPRPQPPASWLAGVPALGVVAGKLGGTAPATAGDAIERAHKALESSLLAKDKGRGHVVITYHGPDAEIGKRLVEAAISAYRTDKLAAAEQLANESVRYYDAEIARLGGELEAGRKAYLEYAASLPSGTVTQSQTISGITSTVTSQPSTAQAQQLAALQHVYDNARVRLQEAQAGRDGAKLAALTEFAMKADSLAVVDPPKTPASPASGIRMLVAMTFMGAVLGAALGAGLVVIATWMDRVVRRPEDVQEGLQAELMGVIPFVPRDRRSA